MVVESVKYSKKVGVPEVRKNLGPFKYSSQMAEKDNMVGTSTGLAVTQVGGDILSIEVGIMQERVDLLLLVNLAT
jgi:ATP-dependent Lon protease